ncbi:hypothetical protein JAAARDRAFT_60568 [Jaapia argillacea MUCL 33604]|uniref:Beta-lactamase-related domain-containing protein n=1 Tax=Jaapia argillacea MUCL 33604 TaxID=933084 RepID=A0A067PI47_9AGAM|nr:hypothetical protein JAAARDRAFT_60568 [Jaapia argillacea MUCL 33604]
MSVNRWTTRLSWLLLGWCSLCHGTSQSPFDISEHSLLSPNFDLYAEEILHRWGVPGMSISVVKVVNDSFDAPAIVETKSYGVAGHDRPVTPETTFAIGSNSKLFTASAIGSLVDAGLLDWSTRIQDILPEFSLLDEYDAGRLTVRDALSHRSGLPRHDLSYGRSSGPHSFERTIGSIKHLRPSAELRDVYQYNNMMFMTAARIIEKVTGSKFQDYVSTHFLNHPALNMTHTSYTPDASYSTGYGVYPSNYSAYEYPFQLDHSVDGAGGIITDAIDVAKWMAFLIKARRHASADSPSEMHDEKIPVSLSSVLAITTGYTVANGSPQYPELSAALYGYGVGLQSYQGQNIWSHGGAIPGMGTQISWVPDTGVGVAVFCNTHWTGNAVSSIVSYRALEDLFNLEHIDWNARWEKTYNRTFPGQPPLAPSSLDFTDVPITPSNVPKFTEALPSLDPPPVTDLSSYLGVYYDPGYGNVTICPSQNDFKPNPTPLSEACIALHSSLQGTTFIPEEPPSSSLSFLIAAPRVWTDYFHISHQSGSLFKGTIYAIVPPSGNRTWPISSSWGEFDLRFRYGGDGSVVGMDWWGVWGAGAVESDERVEVAFNRIG